MNLRKVKNTGCTASLFAVALIAVLMLWLTFKGFRLYRIGRALQADQTKAELLLNGPDGIRGIDPADLGNLIGDTRAHTVALQRELRPFMWATPLFGWAPRVGALIGEADEYLALADAGTRAADLLRPLAEEALPIVQADGFAPGKLAQLIQLLDEHQALLEAAEPEVLRAVAIYRGLESRDQLPSAARQYLPTIDGLLPLAEDGIHLAQVAPELLGADGRPRQYLMWAQNEDELRPTGGYISGAGILTLADGNIVSLDFSSADSINSLSQLELYGYPPAPLQQYMGLEYFLFRDANYWPDLPTSAEAGIELYRLGQPDVPPLDGVIAIDQQFVSLLLGALGPVYVPAMDRNVNSQNVLNTMRSAWGTGDGTVTAEWYNERKSFIGDIAGALIEKLYGNPAEVDVSALAQAIVEAAETKHLQIYARDPEVAQTLELIEWDGRLRPPESGDFLAIVDTNMGYNKVNPLVERRAVYQVTLSGGDIDQATLDLNYVHRGRADSEPCLHILPYSGNLQYDDLMQLCYYNFLRVYVAEGSELVNSTTHSAPADWFVTKTPYESSGATIEDNSDGYGFANFFVIPRGGEMNTRFVYHLPDSVVKRDGRLYTYTLDVHKQAGDTPQPLQVSVTLPPGAELIASSPLSVINGQRVTWQTRLDRDLHYEITYRLSR